jgi:hypothetical protein
VRPKDLYAAGPGVTIPQHVLSRKSIKPILDQEILDPRQAGGYMKGEEWDFRAKYDHPYMLPRSMEPGEFLSILRKHRHPRWPTIGVNRSRFGNNPREDHGLRAHGTIFVCDASERRWLYSVPCDCIPYATIREATWNEDKKVFEGGEFLRGWRSTIEALVKGSYLYPHEELSYLIGQNTFKLAPIQFRR